ncbi:MAG: hypothetical protein M3R15_22765 [Acidobacteriota bacterium]|nr:hypothetical protein [Acidobacteriota bacterium]
MSEAERERPHASIIKQRAREGLPVLWMAMMILAVLWWRGLPHESATMPAASGAVETQPGCGTWRGVTQTETADLVAVAFAADGRRGVAMDSAAHVLETIDGGRSWTLSVGPILVEDEIPATILYADAPTGGRLVIGTGVDASRSTALYERDGAEWKKIAGEWGGVAGGSADGTVLVGGGGMIALREPVGRWEFRQLETAREITLYAASRRGEEIIVVGDYGFVGWSFDGGRNWEAERVGEAALYGVAHSSSGAVVGGAGGLWSVHSGVWTRIADLEAGTRINALCATHSGVIYAGGETSSGAPVVLASHDDGRKWRMEAVAPSGTQSGLTEVGDHAGGIVALGGTDTEVIAATRRGMLLKRSQ